MNVGSIYTMQLGTYSDKYLCVGDFNGNFSLRRVRMPKSKIDGVRLPEIINICYFASPAVNPKIKNKPLKK